MRFGNFNIQKTAFLKNFKGDFFGGLTAAIIALPLALAFGVASGLGASAGLYGAIILGFFASLFGGTPSQISGPTGPMTVIVASVVALHLSEPQFVFAAIILSGLFQIVLGVCKVGDFIKYVPYPVISGFMSGIGIIIILLQINPLFGVKAQATTVEVVLNLANTLQSSDVHSALLGVLTLIVVFATPKKISGKIPPSLIALLLVSGLCAALGWNVPVIGDIPASLPKFTLPSFDFTQMSVLIKVALTLAVLGSVDSLLTSLVADSLTKTKHKSNKELIGQGVGNALAGFFGGIPGAGATMRTVVNIKSGGKTRLSGMIHSAFLLVVLLWLAPFASKIPLAVLAGILVKVGIDIIDYKFLKLFSKVPKRDLSVMLTVLAITVFYDLIFAVEVGVIMSAVILTASLARDSELVVQDIENPELSEKEREVQQKSDYKIRIINIRGVLFFGSTSRLLSRVDNLLGTKCIVLNCSEIPKMDISAIFALDEMIQRLREKNIKVILVLKDEKYAKKLFKMNFLQGSSKEDVCYSIDCAIEKAGNYLQTG